jgi:hypothetical protein
MDGPGDSAGGGAEPLGPYEGIPAGGGAGGNFADPGGGWERDGEKGSIAEVNPGKEEVL